MSGWDPQAYISLMLKGPKEGDESYESHKKENADILASLRRRAVLMTDGERLYIWTALCGPAGWGKRQSGRLAAFPCLPMPPGPVCASEAPRQQGAGWLLHTFSSSVTCMRRLQRGGGGDLQLHGGRDVLLPPHPPARQGTGIRALLLILDLVASTL